MSGREFLFPGQNVLIEAIPAMILMSWAICIVFVKPSWVRLLIGIALFLWGIAIIKSWDMTLLRNPLLAFTMIMLGVIIMLWWVEKPVRSQMKRRNLDVYKYFLPDLTDWKSDYAKDLLNLVKMDFIVFAKGFGFKSHADRYKAMDFLSRADNQAFGGYWRESPKFEGGMPGFATFQRVRRNQPFLREYLEGDAGTDLVDVNPELHRQVQRLVQNKEARVQRYLFKRNLLG